MTVLSIRLLLLPVPTALSISTIFWTAFLSLIVAVSISFFKKLTMVRVLLFSSHFIYGGGKTPLISAIWVTLVSKFQERW